MKFLKKVLVAFVLIIEAVIAAPVWAANHVMPEASKNPYMVMAFLFLRPTLMIFAFFASLIVMIAIGKVAMFASSMVM
jgi:conjugal transfer/type IV secretion protein DotA/TraY